MKTFRTLLFFLIALPLFAAQQTINTGTNPNDGAGDSLRTAFTKVNANFTDLYNTAIFSNSIVQWSTITNTPATLAGYGITNGITAATAASTYAPIASPTFTGTVTIPNGASISGYLTTATAASTYAPLASPTFTGAVTIPNGASISGYLTTATAASTYAPLASPTFTGAVTIPNGASISGYAPLASPTFTGVPAVPTASVDTSTTQAASTAFVVGQAASATPLIDGTAAVGTSTRYARGDHVHPTDTTRSPVASPTFTGTVTIPSGASITSPTINTAANFASAATLNWNSDTYLLRDAANVVAQRNSTTAQGLRIYNTYTDASNYERGVFDWTTSANTLTIGTQNAGTGSSRNLTLAGSSITILANGAAGAAAIYSSGTAACYIGVQQGAKSWSVTTSGHLIPNVSSTYSLGQAGNEVLSLYLSKTITAAGTTGAQTINKATGSVNLAAAATSLVVTDSLVSTSSVIICTVGSNDTTCKSVAAVAASGSFTIYPNAAPTAETRVNFIITN